MWIKKTDKEINIEQEKLKEKRIKEFPEKALKLGIWSFIGIFSFKLISALTIGLDYNKFKPNSAKTIRWEQVPDYYGDFLEDALIGTIIILLLYLIIPSKWWDNRQTLMCNDCKKTFSYSKDQKCTCGGVLIPIEQFKWVDETKEVIVETDWIERNKVEKE